MIDFNFNITNPWSNRFVGVWSKSYKTWFKRKYIELEVYKDTNIISFMIRVTTRQDHAGLRMELGLVGYSVNLNFYDTRHWDYEHNKWVTHDTN